MSELLTGDHPPVARNASEVAAGLIRAAILDGRLDPGSRLKEEALARELGISRTPVREALLLLQAEGLVEAAPNRGATVRTYEPDDLADMYALRALLEAYAVGRAADRIGPDTLRDLERGVARFEAMVDGDIGELARENQAFHATILEAAGSARLAAMLRSVVELPLVYRSFARYSRQQRRSSAAYHQRIVGALRAGDAERAEAIMKAHIMEARDFLLGQLSEQPARAARSKEASVG